MTDSASIALQTEQEYTGETSRQSRWSLKWPALVLSLTSAAYSGTLAYLFVHDDIDQIVNNLCVHSWRFVPGYFTSLGALDEFKAEAALNPADAAANSQISEIESRINAARENDRSQH